MVRSSGFSLPGDTHIREMTIEKEYTDELGLEYSFQFRSYDCAAGFLPLEVDVSGMTGPAAAVVERTQAHSPKPGGHVSPCRARAGRWVDCLRLTLGSSPRHPVWPAGVGDYRQPNRQLAPSGE